MFLTNGTLLQGGKYRIIRHIGSGGFGCTYEAEHTMLCHRVAIKEFFVKDFCNRDASTGRVTIATDNKKERIKKLHSKFIDEAKAIFSMNHPGIVRVTDIFEENETAYYVMEYIDGCSLGEVLEKRGVFTEEEATRIIRAAAEALAHVHKPEDAWSSDEDSHWHNCTTCDGKTDIADHVYDNDCDEDCNICGHKRTVTHMYSEVWLFNKTEHWHVCLLCGAADTPVAHTQGADTCPDCGFEFVDTGENTPPPATESPATNPPATSEPKQEDTGFSFISMLIGFAIGAAISAVTAIIIVKKKR